MTEIFRAGSQLLKVKGMMVFALLCAAGAAYWGWDLFNTYGSRPADGGVLAPLGVRLAWGLGVASLGIAFLAGMWIYGRLYATRILYDRNFDRLHVSTLEFLFSREHVYRAADVEGSTYFAGKMDNPDGVSVNAPWFTLRLKGRSWPLIVDAQGRFPEPELAARLFKSSEGAIAPSPGGDDADELDIHHEDLAGLDPAEGRRRWRLKWLASLREYADAEGQRARWVDANDPDLSWRATQCSSHYLDDLGLRDHGYDWAVGKGLVSAEEAGLLADFHRQAAAYEGPPDDVRYSDAEYNALMLDDPAWQSIVASAGRAKAALLDRLDDAEERRALAGDETR